MPRSQPANPAAAIRRELYFFTLYRVFEAALLCLTVLGPDRFMLPALLITSAILFVTRTGEVRAK